MESHRTAELYQNYESVWLLKKRRRLRAIPRHVNRRQTKISHDGRQIDMGQRVRDSRLRLILMIIEKSNEFREETQEDCRNYETGWPFYWSENFGKLWQFASYRRETRSAVMDFIEQSDDLRDSWLKVFSVAHCRMTGTSWRKAATLSQLWNRVTIVNSREKDATLWLLIIASQHSVCCDARPILQSIGRRPRKPKFHIEPSEDD